MLKQVLVRVSEYLEAGGTINNNNVYDGNGNMIGMIAKQDIHNEHKLNYIIDLNPTRIMHDQSYKIDVFFKVDAEVIIK